MLDKICSPLLKFLDNKNVMLAISIILILLVSTIFGNINHSIRMFASNKWIRLIWVLLIVCIARKHICLALLLGLLYVVSIGGVSEFFENSESFGASEAVVAAAKATQKFENSTTGGFTNQMDEKKEEGEEKKEDKPEDMLANAMDTLMAPFQPKPATKEDFIPFFMTNKDFESGYESSLKGSSKKGCLATDPNQFELVGDACKPVEVFHGELNAQGMNEITGFNIENQMTAQPL